MDAAIHPICVTFYLLKNIVSVMRWPKYNFTAFHFITFLNPNSFYTMHNLHLSLANFVWILRHKNNFLFSLRQIHVSSIKKSCSSVKTIFLHAWCQIKLLDNVKQLIKNLSIIFMSLSLHFVKIFKEINSRMNIIWRTKNFSVVNIFYTLDIDMTKQTRFFFDVQFAHLR